MKILIYILLFLFPVLAFAQQPWYKYSPMDYAWKNVGNNGFSAGGVSYTSLAFNPTNGQPYVAYQDTSLKATVMKFDGSNWVYVGNAGFSVGDVSYTSLAFSLSGQPYVAFMDNGIGKATLMKYDSVYVGINNQQESKFSLYPNPAKDKCKVQYANCNIKSIEIFNEMGVKVYGADFSSGTGNSVEIDLDFPPGVYFMRVTNVGATLAVARVVALVVTPG
jgi:hypothetical protein